jgi:uncharacterized delta-60 repeat protein
MKHINMFIFVTTFCSLITAAYAQVDTAWVRRYNGPGNGIDSAFAIVSDNAGNVYITGTSSGTSLDYATIKYSLSGVQQWVSRYNGPGNGLDIARAITIDTLDNVYVTGRSVITTNTYDFATIKYNAAGETLWTRHFHGPQSFDYASCITVDASGNVYVSGNSYATSSEWNIAIVKYNSLGDTIWTRRYNGPANLTDIVNAMAIDASGNVYITGYTYTSSVNYYDYLTIKYNSSGDTVWTRRYNGAASSSSDYAYALAVDGSGNVYVTGAINVSGTTYDYGTIKYNANGDTVWLRTYNGPGNNVDRALAMAIDASGNVYVTGYSNGGGTSYDYLTIKYNSAGQELWTQRYIGPGYGTDVADAIKLDASGNIYITGYSQSASNYDYATVKYNSNGVQQWVVRYNGLGNGDDYACSLAINQSDVYITGYSVGTSSGLDYTTIKYVQTSGIEENRLALSADRFSPEVYPNPAKVFFTIRSSFLALHSTLKLYDVTGNAVKSEELKGKNNRISLDGIKNGIYFVQVGNEMMKEKLVVTK